MKTYTELEIVMDSDPCLFDGLAPAGEHKFRVWLKDNMHIYRYFTGFAEDLKLRGAREYYSARIIWERIRWESIFAEQVRRGVVFKINNNYAPFMARLAMRSEPELEGMFQVRGRGCESQY